jgi:hypothetical protein
MGGGMWLVGAALGPTGDFLHLVVQAGVGVILYLALNWLRKSEALYEVAGLAVSGVARLRGMARGNTR